jgi:AcrR family transcriptional regulator
MPPERATRAYDSRGRKALAQLNRARILQAARELFVQHGFVGTSVAAIASAAGVSGPTVFAAFGSKVNLLKEAAETTLVGDVEATPMAERPEMLHVEAGRTPEEVLDRLAELVVRRSGHVQPIFGVMYGAAPSSAEIAALVDRFEEQRLTAATRLARTVAARAGVDDEEWIAEVRDCLWVTMSTTLYEAFVVHRGWTPARYQEWLRAAFRIPLNRRPGVLTR